MSSFQEKLQNAPNPQLPVPSLPQLLLFILLLSWLVISPGPNPKSQSDELGIAYFDRDSGDVWIYAYNGQNNAARTSRVWACCLVRAR